MYAERKIKCNEKHCNGTEMKLKELVSELESTQGKNVCSSMAKHMQAVVGVNCVKN